MLDTVEEKMLIKVLESAPDKVVMSSPSSREASYKKYVVNKIERKGTLCYQVEKFTDKQAFHENIDCEQLAAYIVGLFPEVFMQLNIFGAEMQWDYKVTKKGKLLKNSRRMEKATTNDKLIRVGGVAVRGHNRKKNYLLEEGTVIPPLIDLGIFTKDGKIVRTMYDKYKQINRFLELVEDVVKDYPNKEMHIIDFGCGKSYLTFILYYYLVERKGYRVHMTGLDLKQDVIDKCNQTAEKYGYENLHFEMGDINGYQSDDKVDMVVTLHACDTATDYALYNAITWNAGIILSVPCCQKELNVQVQSDHLSLLTKYGIVKERMSALMTDAIRANVLEYCGYKTQLLEFVDFASSPKNILIRAVKSNISKERREKAKEEICGLMEEFHVHQTLVDLVFEKES